MMVIILICLVVVIIGSLVFIRIRDKNQKSIKNKSTAAEMPPILLKRGSETKDVAR